MTAGAQTQAGDCSGVAHVCIEGRLPPAIDDADVLPAGRAGLAVAGPTLASPAGLAVAFDDLVIEDLSTSESSSA